MMRASRAAVALAGLAMSACGSDGGPARMTFFVTSQAVSDGGNLGGVDGADAHCQRLAESAGSRGRVWRAYLSAPPDGANPVVDARDRIGPGPWVNIRGVEIAPSLDALYGAGNALRRRTALTERGDPVPHDIVTGSNADGTLADGDATCRGWTSSTAGKAMLGHADRECEGAHRQR